MDARDRRIGILAGGGVLPREVADAASRRGIPVHIVAIDGEADGDFAGHPTTCVNWGQIGGMIRAFREAGTTDLVIVGRVQRPEIWDLRPDLGFFVHLPKILKIVAAGGDDGVLRRVVRFFEQQGLTLIAPGDAAPEVVVAEGPIGAARPQPGDTADIALGLELVRALGIYDIGQSVIAARGAIVAIEGAEGTDRMIARAAELRAAAGRTGGHDVREGVLVKRSKPGQDVRVDMPAIGPATVTGVEAAGLTGIAVEAGKVIVAERAETVRRADAAGLFVEGVADAGALVTTARFDARKSAMALRHLGRHAPEQHAALDAIKGLAVIEALRPFGCGRAAVVVRNHVLSVEAGEGVDATLERASGLRQWASITHNRRGIAALRDAKDLTPAVVTAVAKAGYAGIAIATDGVSSESIVAADANGLFVAIPVAKEMTR